MTSRDQESPQKHAASEDMSSTAIIMAHTRYLLALPHLALKIAQDIHTRQLSKDLTTSLLDEFKGECNSVKMYFHDTGNKYVGTPIQSRCDFEKDACNLIDDLLGWLFDAVNDHIDLPRWHRIVNRMGSLLLRESTLHKFSAAEQKRRLPIIMRLMKRVLVADSLDNDTARSLLRRIELAFYSEHFDSFCSELDQETANIKPVALPVSIKPKEETDETKSQPVELESGDVKEEQREAPEDGEGKRDSIPTDDLKTRFAFCPGQALFDDKDLNLPSGSPIEMLQKLVSQFGKVVPYKKFDNHYSSAAPGTVHKDKSTITQQFKKHRIPCEIVAKRNEGYILHSKWCKKRSKKRVRK